MVKINIFKKDNKKKDDVEVKDYHRLGIKDKLYTAGKEIKNGFYNLGRKLAGRDTKNTEITTYITFDDKNTHGIQFVEVTGKVHYKDFTKDNNILNDLKASLDDVLLQSPSKDFAVLLLDRIVESHNKLGFKLTNVELLDLIISGVIEVDNFGVKINKEKLKEKLNIGDDKYIEEHMDKIKNRLRTMYIQAFHKEKSHMKAYGIVKDLIQYVNSKYGKIIKLDTIKENSKSEGLYVFYSYSDEALKSYKEEYFKVSKEFEKKLKNTYQKLSYLYKIVSNSNDKVLVDLYNKLVTKYEEYNKFALIYADNLERIESSKFEEFLKNKGKYDKDLEYAKNAVTYLDGINKIIDNYLQNEYNKINEKYNKTRKEYINTLNKAFYKIQEFGRLKNSYKDKNIESIYNKLLNDYNKLKDLEKQYIEKQKKLEDMDNYFNNKSEVDDYINNVINTINDINKSIEEMEKYVNKLKNQRSPLRSPYIGRII